MTGASSLEILLQDDVRPNHLTEVEWLLQYMNTPHSREAPPLFLSLGQSDNTFPAQLSNYLGQSPAFVQGYGLSMYGYPPLRRTLRKFIEQQYQLQPDHYEKGMYEVAVVQTGTRACIFNFVLWLRDNYVNNFTGRLFTFAPGWDYASIFKFGKFETSYLELDANNGFLPDIDNVLHQLNISLSQREKPVLALNVQHNPTGVNWDEQITQQLLRWCVQHDVPVLLDDAYFAVCEPGVKATAAQAILLNMLQEAGVRNYPWLALRSLGKQYCCNGWGIGILSAPPTLADQLVNRYQTIHHYNINGAFQYAMNEWLNSEDADKFVASYNVQIANNRALFKRALIDKLGYEAASFPRAVCTSYQLFPLPKSFGVNDTGAFIQSCISKAGIVFSDAWPVPHNDKHGMKKYNYVRCFLGGDGAQLNEAAERMAKHKIFYY